MTRDGPAVTSAPRGQLDVPFLRSLLAFAYGWHVAAFDTDISISRYVDGWGRAGRRGADRDGGRPSGRRRLVPALPHRRPGLRLRRRGDARDDDRRRPRPAGRGDRRQLLAALVERARKAGYSGLSVSTENGKPETEYYLGERFELVGEDGATLTLRRAL